MEIGYALTAITLIILLGRNVIDAKYKLENRINIHRFTIISIWPRITIQIKNRTSLRYPHPLQFLILILKKKVTK